MAWKLAPMLELLRDALNVGVKARVFLVRVWGRVYRVQGLEAAMASMLELLCDALSTSASRHVTRVWV